MTPQDRITKLAQSAYLARTGNYNDVEGDDLTDFLNKCVDWFNQWLDELELEADWQYVRVNRYKLGTIPSVGEYSIELDPDEVRKLIVSPYRNVVLSQDGGVVANFTPVSPNQITNPANPDTDDRVTTVGNTVIFSRPFTDTEVGADVLADIIAPMPQLTLTDTTILDLIKPFQLSILGMAKNMLLPDLVRGGTSPSFTQKYGDLLQKAVAENNMTASAFSANGENLSYIAGVW